jgi:large subunit ribosomal protein L10
VVKNRLARRAAEGSPISQLDRWFRGPTALVYHPHDAVAMAKQLVDFAKDHPSLEVRAGLLDRSQVVAGEQAQAVASLPTLDQARAILLAMIMAPATQLARLIAAPGAQLARAVDARVKKEGGASAPAGEGAE